jgi:hypothetical protein
MDTREAFLRAAESVARLLRDPAVAERWDQPSALQGFTVGGLAAHLAAQVHDQVSLALDAADPGADRIGLLDHYARVAWTDGDLDSEVNTGIRRKGEAQAEAGAAGLTAKVEEALAALRERLPAEPADRVVHLPWTGWSFSLDDLLITRMMEIAVHSDDLAVSCGIATPDLPPEVIEPVTDLLSRLALRRHGQAAVLRALSRAERAPSHIAAF